MSRLIICTLIIASASSAHGDLLWDNGVFNGWNGRAISPPGFPDIRVADDIVVPAPGWEINEMRFRIREDAGWNRGHALEVYIRETDPETGGPMPGEDANVVHLETAFRVETLNCYFGGCFFEYVIEDQQIELTEGHYWLGIRNPHGGGTGTNYWDTSDGGPDGGDTSTAYFSLDRGETWMDEGPGWQHAFNISGSVIPEPSTLVLLGAAGVIIFRRRAPGRRGGTAMPDGRRGSSSRPISVIVAVTTTAAVLASAPAEADLLWDNGMRLNGNARAISPPAFPDIRVADDFIVGGPGWRIEEMSFRVLEDGGFNDGGVLEVYVRETDPDTGGPVAGEDANLVHIETGFRREEVNCYFRCDYEYLVEGQEIELDAGRYWLGIRNPRGNGAGTNYWFTSDGGVDGGDTSTGYFSLDSGETWMNEGPDWHHAFNISGSVIPEPSTLVLLAAMGMLIFRRSAGRA